MSKKIAKKADPEIIDPPPKKTKKSAVKEKPKDPFTTKCSKFIDFVVEVVESSAKKVNTLKKKINNYRLCFEVSMRNDEVTDNQVPLYEEFVNNMANVIEDYDYDDSWLAEADEDWKITYIDKAGKPIEELTMNITGAYKLCTTAGEKYNFMFLLFDCLTECSSDNKKKLKTIATKYEQKYEKMAAKKVKKAKKSKEDAESESEEEEIEDDDDENPFAKALEMFQNPKVVASVNKGFSGFAKNLDMNSIREIAEKFSGDNVNPDEMNEEIDEKVESKLKNFPSEEKDE